MANKLDPMDLKQILTLHLDGYKFFRNRSKSNIFENDYHLLSTFYK